MYEEICYKKPFLREVVARVDFAGALEVLQKSLPQKLANELIRDFPISEPADAIAQELQWNAQKGVSHRETKFKQWNFFGKEREKQASLTSTFAFVTYKRYSQYENMASEFQNVLGAITRAFPEAKASRFGLRYVNVIEGLELQEPDLSQRFAGYLARISLPEIGLPTRKGLKLSRESQRTELQV